jgi:hypothetical protein
MDCNHARLLLEVAHPIATELDARETEQLAAHLASCPDCGALAENDRLADEQLAKVMRDVPVPDGFKFRLLNRLNAERDAWYRRWLVRAGGVAAALVLAVGLVYATWWSKKPDPNWEAVAAEVNEMLYTPELVQEAFAAKGVTMEAPPRFDYNDLQLYGMADFQGKRVPYLLFFHKGTGDKDLAAFAKVYVLSERDFNIHEARKQIHQGSRQSIRLLTFPDQPRYLYVVIHTPGRPLEQVFFKPLGPLN